MIGVRGGVTVSAASNCLDRRVGRRPLRRHVNAVVYELASIQNLGREGKRQEKLVYYDIVGVSATG